MRVENNGREPTKNKKKGQSLSTSSSPSAANTVVDDLAALKLQTPESPLLRLLLELRQKIYAYLLDIKHVCSSVQFAYQPWVRDGYLGLRATSPPFHICTAILHTNKQVHDESIKLFYSSNLFIRLSLYNDDIYWTQSLLEGTEMGFVCSNPVLVVNLKGHALDVKIIQEKSKILRCQLVFPALFLPRFLAFLQTMCDSLPKWGKEHAIHLHLRQKYRTGPEGLLLEPWRSLHGIESVVVSTGLVTAGYATSLQTAMMAPFKPQKWLQNLAKIEEGGTEEFEKGLYQAALDKYVHVIALLESVYKSHHGSILVSMSPQFNQAINKLRYKCELNQAFCRLKGFTAPLDGVLLRHKRLTATMYAADNAVDLAEDTEADLVWKGCAPWIPANDRSGYTAAERSKARYRRAEIMMEVGEWGFACAELEMASQYTPEDTAIQSAFERAKAKYDPRARPGAVLRGLGVRGMHGY
ncbi:MAG: hypothetical protein Q9226_006933 [Calogaya cf. arnoldii]